MKFCVAALLAVAGAQASHFDTYGGGYNSGLSVASIKSVATNGYTQHASETKHAVELPAGPHHGFDSHYGYGSGSYGLGHDSLGYNTHSLGYNTHNLGYNAHNLGYNTHNLGYSTHNLGYNTHNLGYNTHNLGYSTHNLGYKSGYNRHY
jgi:hypothetical protein